MLCSFSVGYCEYTVVANGKGAPAAFHPGQNYVSELGTTGQLLYAWIGRHCSSGDPHRTQPSVSFLARDSKRSRSDVWFCKGMTIGYQAEVPRSQALLWTPRIRRAAGCAVEATSCTPCVVMSLVGFGLVRS